MFPINRWVFLVALLAVPLPVSAAVPAGLCTGNPCTVAADAFTDNGSALDFGAVDLVVARDVTLKVWGATPSVSLQADSIVLEPGATIEASSPSDQGPDINLYANVGNVEMRADRSKKARLEMDGTANGSGGDLTVYADGAGDILFDGVVSARAATAGISISMRPAATCGPTSPLLGSAAWTQKAA